MFQPSETNFTPKKGHLVRTVVFHIFRNRLQQINNIVLCCFHKIRTEPKRILRNNRQILDRNARQDVTITSDMAKLDRSAADHLQHHPRSPISFVAGFDFDQLRTLLSLGINLSREEDIPTMDLHRVNVLHSREIRTVHLISSSDQSFSLKSKYAQILIVVFSVRNQDDMRPGNSLGNVVVLWTLFFIG